MAMPVAKEEQEDIWGGDFMLKGPACCIMVQAQVWVAGKAQVVHLVPEMGLTPKHTSQGTWLGAEQHPAEAGGSWAVSLTAEMGTLVHV